MTPMQKTERGFSYATFEDGNGETCSIQDSSVATESMVWIGVDSVVPKVLVFNKGWIDVELPHDAMTSGRMHLTVDQVKQLLPMLNRFVETGSIDDVGGG